MTLKQTEAQYDEKFKEQAVELALPELSRGVSQRVVAEKLGVPFRRLNEQITELRDENVKLRRDLAGLQLGEAVDFAIAIPEKVYDGIVTDEHFAYVRSLIVGAYIDGKFK